MADIVERLRRPDILLYQYAASVSDDGAFLQEAADEIERLREALHKVLGIVGNFPVDRFEYNIIKEARAALKEKE